MNIHGLTLEQVKTGIDIHSIGTSRLALELCADHNEGAKARKGVQYFLQKKGVSPKDTQRAILMSDELLNNAISYGSLPKEQVSLHVTISDEKLLIQVNDLGNGLDARTAEQMQEFVHQNKPFWTEETYRNRGRGYQIIHKLTKHITFSNNTDGGLTVKVEMEREGS